MHAERGYATQGTTAAPALKVQLRELYKRIHPDRFHGFPPARDTNERSFKLLQEYLAAGACTCNASNISTSLNAPMYA